VCLCLCADVVVTRPASPPAPCVLFVPALRVHAKSPVQFSAGSEFRGFKPLGVKAFLDTCNLNNASLWCASQALFRNGILVPRSKLTTTATEARMEVMAQLYPVNEQTRALGLACHERDGNLRGFHMFGDDDDIATFWASMYLSDEGVRGWDVHTRAICWTASAPGTVYVPYLDIDERGLQCDFHRVWTTRVSPTLLAIQKQLVDIAPTHVINPVIFFNHREDGDLWKFSFHVHWPLLGVVNIMQWKDFLMAIQDLPRKFQWTKNQTGQWQVVPDEKTPIFDPAVYGGARQLFRGPFCGKGENPAAVMKPCTVQEINGVMQYVGTRDYSHDAIVRAVLAARIARWPTGLTMLTFSAPSRASVLPSADAPPPRVQLSLELDQSPMTEFLQPFIVDRILPAWQTHRIGMMMRLGGVKGAVVPTKNLVIVSNSSGASPGVRFLRVEGDTFCETDAAHIHTRNRDTVGVMLDFTKGAICQTCFACGRAGQAVKYVFLHLNNQIEIAPEAGSKFTAMSYWTTSKSPHQLLLDYYPNHFIHQRVTRMVWVYDDECRVWRTDVGGNMIIGRMIDDLNRKHAGYLKAYKNIMIDKQTAAFERANPEADTDAWAQFYTKTHAAARTFIAKNTPFVSMSASARGKVIDELKNFTVHKEVQAMNIHPHLIPMKNMKQYNIFTGEVGDMAREHLFTSVVDAELIADRDEIKIIEDWFDEISTGDNVKCVYLKKISAYCFTYLDHDRKFYVLVGGGQNGKGALKQFIMDISKGPDGFDSRAKNLAQSFWASRANANQGPENCTPESYELMNKTFYYTDDIQPVPLDTNKLKRIVAHEEQSGRGLYGKPVDVKPHGKVMWTTNFEPDIPGIDNACWERLVLLYMNTKYVPSAHDVDPKRFRFLKDHSRYMGLLEKKDAFFTVAVQALTAHYQSLEWDPIRRAPKSLGSFDLPPSVVISLREARATQLPLSAFMNAHTERTTQPLYCVTVEELFKNYIVYLENMNEIKARRSTTQSNFVQLLASALDVHVAAGTVDGVRLVKPVTPTMNRGQVPMMDQRLSHDNPYVGQPEGSYLDRAMGPS
jgi:hypothetical protein